MSRAALAALVFGAGTGSLATEIAASRLLAPYFGSSTIVWANLIGIVLAALAFGYWLGGRIADRRPRPQLLGLIVLAAAVWVAITPFVARPFLDAAVGNLDDASAGAVIGSFFAYLGLITYHSYFVRPLSFLTALADKQLVMLARSDRAKYFLLIVIDIYPVHLWPGGHEFADAAVTNIEDPLDHLLLCLL